MTPRNPTTARPPPARRAHRWRRVIAVLAPMLILAGFGFWALLPERLFDAPLSAVLEARDGSLLGARIAADGQWRFPARAEVPRKFRRALIVYEDKRFEQHAGVDVLAVARALRLNLREGRVVSGGSTLTMQLARLSRGDPERTLGAKAIEALLALRLETAYDKSELLALYAAHAPFGGNVVGLEAAAWRYFGRDPHTLSWAEAATLAVLPNNPSLVHLKRNRARLLAKRDSLLRRLHAAGDLTALDLELALSEPLTAAPHALPDLAPHLLDSGPGIRNGTGSNPRWMRASRPRPRMCSMNSRASSRVSMSSTPPRWWSTMSPAKSSPTWAILRCSRRRAIPAADTPSTSSGGLAARAASSNPCCTPPCSTMAR
jgi:membrane peptidoglycan carboxypeptidase